MNTSVVNSVERHRVDVLVSGGGMLGVMQAYAIAVQFPTLKVAIIEASELKPHASPSFDERSIALSYGSILLLEKLRLWGSLKEYAEPIQEIKVSDRGHIGKTHLTANQFDLNAFGYVIEVVYLEKVLQPRLDELPNVSWLRPCKINDITQSSEAVLCQLSTGQHISTKLFIIAEGAQSSSRDKLKFDLKQQNYGKHAIVANIQVASHGNIAYERFTPDGPVALLPLPKSRYSLVWCVKPDKAKFLADCAQSDFLIELQKMFGSSIGPFQDVGKRVAYPLSVKQVSRMFHHRTALIGNAAHTIHPIAGQGFNLGLRDVMCLTQCIAESESDIGAFSVLKKYDQTRQKDMQRVVTMTDSLVKLFSKENQLVALGRTLGLMSMQCFPELKKSLVHQALGLYFPSSNGVV
ncbi:2-octaprenyl-6-methoxyphenyl hydroxylase [Algicola sagamiensis]|uniref:2-octaprenyl-6-methoxyphenyl hydroxylase n=1 Tax=Algicola sagamiensis TaxID=163869 RepID=UPI00035DCC9B|nr:2-octaprenyl-6-methoxyphenyl hydroxylase [Algicola sagamiensis]